MLHRAGFTVVRMREGVDVKELMADDGAFIVNCLPQSTKLLVWSNYKMTDSCSPETFKKAFNEEPDRQQRLRVTMAIKGFEVLPPWIPIPSSTIRAALQTAASRLDIKHVALAASIIGAAVCEAMANTITANPSIATVLHVSAGVFLVASAVFGAIAKSLTEKS